MFLLCSFISNSNAGIVSAVVGGAVAGSIASDGARQAGDKIANSIRNEKSSHCLILIKDGDYNQSLIDYNDIKNIVSYTCGSGWGNDRRQCYWIHTYSDSFIFSMNTPQEIMEMGNKQCH